MLLTVVVSLYMCNGQASETLSRVHKLRFFMCIYVDVREI